MANHFSDPDSNLVPPELRPLGAWAYFGLSVLFSLPILGLVFLIVFSFSDANINRRNYARSYFCMLLVVLILCVIAFFTGVLTETIDAVAAGQWPSYLEFLPWA